MRYRVEELAGRAGTSVDTVRFYQTRGLLPQPEREGRVVFYSDEHVERLVRIRELKDKGFTLKSIKGLLSGEIDAADEALLAMVDSPGDSAAEGPQPDPGATGSAHRDLRVASAGARARGTHRSQGA